MVRLGVPLWCGISGPFAPELRPFPDPSVYPGDTDELSLNELEGNHDS